ncbi:GH36-type glycosyl hydrolase domain-containing protein [Leptospira jelokensis]|uniref:Cellobiose phosphorylase n=1 Tax=Leptospira jelokensis TaxID=2484931 RepID=A0A4Z1A487_9LEPT|nr:cellobiose phosphorylase [Leptospira jelokensis]TGL75587.1 cellobiose phosphorylase [Leptospira jelokensis]
MYQLQNESGLVFKYHPNLSLHSIFHNHTFVNLYVGNGLEPSVSNLYLNVESNEICHSIPLFSVMDQTTVQTSESLLLITHVYHSIRIECSIQLHTTENSWKYRVNVINEGEVPIRCDLVYVSDMGLCDYQAARLNEAFVSQYIHHQIFEVPSFGVQILSRQNESVFGMHPSCLHFANQKMVHYATDGLDIYRDGKLTSLPNRRRQGEHSVIALGSETIVVPQSQGYQFEIVVVFFPDLKSITSFAENSGLLPTDWNGFPNEDLTALERKIKNKSIFQNPKIRSGDALAETQLQKKFPDDWRAVERDENGNLLSFFTEKETYVSLSRKEKLCLRPQGQVSRTGKEPIPSESSLTFTSYFSGIFLSQLTQGHTSLNLFLTRNQNLLGKQKSKGLRVFCKEKDTWYLLETPSYMQFQPKFLEWVYWKENTELKVSITANDDDSIQLTFISTETNPLEILISFSIGLDGDNGDIHIPPNIQTFQNKVQITPNPKSPLSRRLAGKGFQIFCDQLETVKISDDRVFFADGSSLSHSYLTMQTQVHSRLSFSIKGDLETTPSKTITPPNDENVKCPNLLSSALDLKDPSFLEMVTILPWYKQNAEIHYLNPRGLEQFSGGGWGTRDVCQGAFEFLLSQGNFQAIRELLLHVFSEQNEDGDWPQWFMIYERDKGIRANDSHGDILYWPLLSLLTYLERTENFAILEETITTFVSKQKKTIRELFETSLREIQKRFIPNTNLPMYGNGDWNDSMQPKEEEFRKKAVSVWTAELQYTLFSKLGWFYESLGELSLNKHYNEQAKKLKTEIHSICMPNGVASGLVKLSDSSEKTYFLHPLDDTTKIHYSVLPMIYGILSNTFELKEANEHLTLIKEHLTGPDGVRLFDKPVSYLHGDERFFRRAETASFFGREIGLMYTHAHLRYCEALAHMGKSDEFFTELNRTNPIGITKRIPTANTRQSNCYFSSSDAFFLNRYDADTYYERIKKGEVALEGGWRVYSSGPGIFLKLFFELLLGIQVHQSKLILDPILPKSFDGLIIRTQIFGIKTKIVYRVLTNQGLVESILWNGTEIPTKRMINPYRKAGLIIFKTDFETYQKDSENTLEVFIK